MSGIKQKASKYIFIGHTIRHSGGRMEGLEAAHDEGHPFMEHDIVLRYMQNEALMYDH